MVNAHKDKMDIVKLMLVRMVNLKLIMNANKFNHIV